MSNDDKQMHHIKGAGEYTTGDVLAFSVDPDTGDVTLHGLGWPKGTWRIRQRDWMQFYRTVNEEHAAIAERHGG